MPDLLEIELTPQTERTLGELRALGQDLQQKGIRSALHAGGNVIVRAMRGTAPDDPATTGSHLYRSINKTQVKTGDGLLTGAGRRFVDMQPGEVGLVIGPNKKIGGRSTHGTAAITEWGAKPHRILPREGALRILGRFISGGINHPGVRPQYWMARALEASGSQYFEGFYRGLERWMDKNGR